MQKLLFILLLAIVPHVYGNDVTEYLVKYKKTGISDFNLEQKIIQRTDFDVLVNELTRFYIDTVINVRQKAYYLTYRNAFINKSHQSLAINILLRGCSDRNGGIIGQNLEFLKNFNIVDFDRQSLQTINLQLANSRIQHYKELVLLAGFVGTGKDILYQKWLESQNNAATKWFISLALARMANSENISYCVNMVKTLPINDNLIDNIIPDLIYTRQRECIDLCVKILNNNEKLCHSLNPDDESHINCGFRILELLAPIVINIPLKVDATGIVYSGNYEELLNKVKKWFLDNPKYQIQTDKY